MSETVEDILREMRDWGCHSYVDGNAHELIVLLADRIEAAYNGLPGMWIVPAENAKLREENGRLKAALKPVLDYDYKQTCNLDDFMASVHCMNIINETQRIYNGGAK